MHGTWAAFCGLLIGPILQCYLITPKELPRKEVLIVTLATSLIFIPIQILSLALCLVLYVWAKRSLLALIPFYAVRMLADILAEVVCHYGRASSLRIIFINMNALVNRMILV